MLHGKGGGASAEGGEAATSAADESQTKRRTFLSLSQRIVQAFDACSPRKTLSLAALKKHLADGGYKANRKNNHRLRRELDALVTSGVVVRVTGRGASGSFKAGRRGGQAKAKPRGKKRTSAARASAKKPLPRRGRDPPKQRKKQPAVSKPKGLRGRPAGGASKRPLKE